MSTTLRIVFYGLIGICGGLLAWPFAELVIYAQGGLYSNALYSIVLGAVIGLFMGGAFGLGEGIIQKSGKKLVAGLVTGIVVGTIGGALGLVAGQEVIQLIGSRIFDNIQSLQDLPSIAALSIGWAALGIFIGIVEGVRSRSFAKIRNGLLGGLIGGFLGGFLFNASIHLSIVDAFLARLFGLVILGFCIGLFYGLVEVRLARASLLALNGPSKGQEILLTQRAMTIGMDEDAGMTIAGYTQVAPEHATILRKKGAIVIQDNKSKAGTFVNDKKVTETVVDDGDVIRIGDAQFLLKKK
jgi:MFS family permease